MVDLRFSATELADRRNRITSFISEQVAAAGVEGVIIGLSGGLDSSVTAALAVKALGSGRVHGLSLPAAVSADEHRSDAERLAHDLGISFDEIEIEPLVEDIVSVTPSDDVGRVPRGNARARIRAVLSYTLANEENHLVLGTGNRSEALVGYFTKYGDGAVDCHPIGNLYKCQVRQLARELAIPEGIIEKPPTAELWESQTDEDELGLSYDDLDPILALHVDGPLSVAATARTLDCPVETVEHVADLVDRSAHKRTLPPTP